MQGLRHTEPFRRSQGSRERQAAQGSRPGQESDGDTSPLRQDSGSDAGLRAHKTRAAQVSSPDYMIRTDSESRDYPRKGEKKKKAGRSGGRHAAGHNREVKNLLI